MFRLRFCKVYRHGTASRSHVSNSTSSKKRSADYRKRSHVYSSKANRNTFTTRYKTRLLQLGPFRTPTAAAPCPRSVVAMDLRAISALSSQAFRWFLGVPRVEVVVRRTVGPQEVAVPSRRVEAYPSVVRDIRAHDWFLSGG